jgi:threonine dehydrogenase-like Zn-dependent dehydrogenase
VRGQGADGIGHVAVGIIEELGEGVVGFEVGERVGFMPASNTCREYFPSEELGWDFILGRGKMIGF